MNAGCRVAPSTSLGDSWVPRLHEDTARGIRGRQAARGPGRATLHPRLLHILAGSRARSRLLGSRLAVRVGTVLRFSSCASERRPTGSPRVSLFLSRV